MKIAKVKIHNFKCYAGNFELPLNDGINIIVGSNESGKSTILEAIHLALTGMLNGRPLRNDISSYLFNLAVEKEYVARLYSANPLPPPSIFIELYFSGEEKELADLEGDGNSDKVKASGVVLKIEFDADNYSDAYAELIKTKTLEAIPIEYYTATAMSYDLRRTADLGRTADRRGRRAGHRPAAVDGEEARRSVHRMTGLPRPWRGPTLPATITRKDPPMKKTVLGLAAALSLALTAGAQAQAYPTKPVTMIVPFAAGGPTDIIARLVGEHMSIHIDWMIGSNLVDIDGVHADGRRVPVFRKGEWA